MFEWILDPNAWAALATLTALEIVLGIDNIIFITLLVGRLPEAQRRKARILGLGMAMAGRILLLLSLAWVRQLTAPRFVVWEHAVSGRDMILLGGGLFLLYKSSVEIHNSLEGDEHPGPDAGSAPAAALGSVLAQIALIDLVFSLDSVITAVGMAEQVEVMVIAIVIAVLVMMLAAEVISGFVESHPTVKMLALSFLTLIGMSLVAEVLHFHIPKGYIYFAMAFSIAVEVLNIRVRARRGPPVRLRRVAPTAAAAREARAD